MGKIFVGAHVLAPDAGATNSFGHLFLVYSQDDQPSDDDSVIRSGPSEGLGGFNLVESSVRASISKDHPLVWGEDFEITDPYQYYSFSEVYLGDRNAEDIWNTMVGIADQVASYEVPYLLLQQNSNSFVYTLMSSTYLDVNPAPVPTGGDLIFPGSWNFFSNKYESNDNGIYGTDNWTYAVKGSDRDDVLAAIGTNGNFVVMPGDTVYGGAGNDTIYDDARMDFIDGGLGNDSIYLMDDGARDIVILDLNTVDKFGTDTIYGGGSQDRIVIRTSDIKLVDGQPVGPETGGMALLGGFTNGPSASGTTFASGPWLADLYTDDSSNLQIETDYNLYKVDNVDMLRVDTYVNGNWTKDSNGNWSVSETYMASFVIENFQNGDFGIELRLYDDTGEYSMNQNPVDIAYFKNYGQAYSIPGELVA